MGDRDAANEFESTVAAVTLTKFEVALNRAHSHGAHTEYCPFRQSRAIDCHVSVSSSVEDTAESTPL